MALAYVLVSIITTCNSTNKLRPDVYGEKAIPDISDRPLRLTEYSIIIGLLGNSNVSIHIDIISQL